MATLSGNNQYLLQGAMEGFSQIVMPITAFAKKYDETKTSVGDIVRVPYVTNNSASYSFDYDTGYIGNGQGVVEKQVTLDQLKYQPIRITDSEFVKMSPESIIALGNQAGQALASDVISASMAAVVTQANFANSGSYTSTNFTSSMVAIATLQKFANDNKWPVNFRSLICGTSLYAALMQNTAVTNAANFGSTGPIQDGVINGVLGMKTFLTSLTLPNSDTGFACNSNAILFANGVHIPQENGAGYIQNGFIHDSKTDLSIGLRHYAEPGNARTVRIIECLFGVGVGNPNALYHIK